LVHLLAGIDARVCPGFQPNPFAIAPRLVSLDIRQVSNALPLKTTVERRSHLIWDRQLKGIVAVTWPQQGLTPQRGITVLGLDPAL
tara:strand:+ start:358 stop:615 length:258 start_codon:yes stop_codon:yes gene_type:complete